MSPSSPSFLSSFGLVFVVAAIGCSSSSSQIIAPTDSGSPSDGDACTASPPVGVTVSPSTLDMLTCTKQTFTAEVHGTCDTSVAWTASGGGSIDATGLYQAPIQVPTPAQVTIAASSKADPTKKGASTVTLHTALPKPAIGVGPSADDSLFHHQLAAGGDYVYAVQLGIDKSGARYQYTLRVAASSDGGATFAAPVSATDVPDAEIALMAPSIAVDAGDPKTVYVAYTIDGGEMRKTNDRVDPMSGQTLALAVSHDAGKTFTGYVLESHPSGWEEYGDVTSPSAGVVVVEAPNAEHGHLFRIYTDTTKGAGFADLDATQSFPVVKGALSLVAGPTAAPWNDVKSNGGTAGMESPRVVSDGSGKVCVVFDGGYLSGSEGDGKMRVAAQCSRDAGKTFGDAIDVDFDGATQANHHPVAAFGPSGTLAVAYWSDDGAGSHATLHLALGKDSATSWTFDTPKAIPAYVPPAGATTKTGAQYPAIAWEGGTLWLAYLVTDGDGPKRLVVDKSCDGGTTWSGAQLLNGPEPTLDGDYQWPGLAMVKGAPSVFVRKGSASADDLPAMLIRLVP